jgi:anthranilate phosphoribosyltransferase
MELFLHGVRQTSLQGAQPGSLETLPDLPRAIDPASTAGYIRSVLAGERPVPDPIAMQVLHIVQAEQQLERSCA